MTTQKPIDEGIVREGKEITNYLHLYLPCKVLTPIGEGVMVSVHKEETDYAVVVYGAMGPDFEESHDVKDVKPLLRPLEDMIKEEAEELYKVDPAIVQGDEYSEPFEITRLLLLKKFDIFGLIDAGLAIDETLKPHTK